MNPDHVLGVLRSRTSIAPGGARATFTAAAGALLLLAGILPGPLCPDSRASDLQLRGLIDLVGSGNSRAFQSNWYNLGDDNFDAYRLRLFAEGRYAGGLSVYTQFLFDDATAPRALGAYVMYTPRPDLDLHLIAGKIAWPIGTWAARTYSSKNPLIGIPLMYQYHSTLRYDDLPANVGVLLRQAGNGQWGVAYATNSPRRGMPVIYDECWDFGVSMVGSHHRWEYCLAAVNGSPSHMNTVVDDNNGKSVLARFGCLPVPALRLGASGAYGPYLPDAVRSALPEDRQHRSYNQILGMADVQLDLGHAELYCEGYLNRWQTPSLGNLDVRGYYVQGKYTFFGGLYAAARWEEMFFGKVTDSAGNRVPWDDDVDRLEAGFGYRITRNALAKAVYQRDTWHEQNDTESDAYANSLGALQLSFTF